MKIAEVLCALTLMLACVLSAGCGSGEPTVIQPGEGYQQTDKEKQNYEKGKEMQSQSLEDQLKQQD
jgi:hypothetical protein